MHKSSVIVAVVLSICFTACSSLCEKDLEDLQSPNHIVKKEAIGKISEPGRFPFTISRRLFGGGIEKKAVTILVEMLNKGKESEDIHLSILKTLGDLGMRTEVPIEPLIDKLKDENPRIRLRAVESLGKIRNEKAVSALLQLLEEEPNKYPIIWSLGQIGDKRAIPALNTLLSSEDKFLQYNARKALKKIR